MGRPLTQEAKLGSLDSLVQQSPLYPPSREFSRQARVSSLEQYQSLCDQAANNPEAFWDRWAQELHWFKPYSRVLDRTPPRARWFAHGETNACYNCLDAHLATPRRNKAALIWEGEPGEIRALTYQMLHREVCRFANVLKQFGVQQGDAVAVHMPLVPEAVIAMLACARIGAVHLVIGDRLPAEAIADRCNDVKVKLIVTADGGWRRGRQMPYKTTVDRALERSPTVQKCLVLKRMGLPVAMHDARDVWLHEALRQANARCPAEPLAGDAPLFSLYTSGASGEPKRVEHATAGYQLFAKKTLEWAFDLRDDDVYWCTAELDSIAGHSCAVYGPLAAGATVFLYEGAHDWPDHDRWRRLIEDHRVSVLHMTAAEIYARMKRPGAAADCDLSSLRLLGSSGDALAPAAWTWLFETIGGGRCPIVDAWLQAETGGILLAPLPGAMPLKPGCCAKPLPGVTPEIVGDAGQPTPVGALGRLAITKPWPGMARALQVGGAPGQFLFLSGDCARQDDDGDYWIAGPVDDAIDLSGQRFSPLEIENALTRNPAVVDAAAVGRTDEVRGQSVTAFVVLARGCESSDRLQRALEDDVRRELGALAVPDEIRFVPELPKTHSGRTLRRLLRADCSRHAPRDEAASRGA